MFVIHFISTLGLVLLYWCLGIILGNRIVKNPKVVHAWKLHAWSPLTTWIPIFMLVVGS